MDFGILCNGTIFQQWQFDAIKLLVDGGHRCRLLIVNANPVSRQSFSEKLIYYPYSKFLCRVWFRYLIKPASKRNTDLNDFYQGVPQISCITSGKGISQYFSEPDVEQVKSYKLDFILRFGFGIIKGEILESAKYGVWSYHHDDDRKYRGVPTGFWEIMYGDPVNAAILQRLTDTIDSGIILYKAYFPTINHSWQANLDQLLSNSVEWPLQVCRKIKNGNTEFLSQPNPPSSILYKMPGNLVMMHFLIKVFLNKVSFHFRDLFLAEKWNVGIIPFSAENLIKPGEYSIPEPSWLKISPKKSMYHADPFGIKLQDKYYILCEEYDYSNLKGVLTSLILDSQTHQINKKAISLEKEYHLAFPYLFEYDGIPYCIPENSENCNVDLYRYDISEGKLTFEQTLIENLQAVDPCLFQHDGTWWLFFTDKTSTNTRLHIWYSNNLRGPYKPHDNNPVKVDIRSSRPAGNPFLLEGKLMRPAQDCSERSGRRICINQVTKLSVTEFVETEYALLNPSPVSHWRDGMHTFSVTEDAIIVDGKKEIFIWTAFINKLSTKIRRVVGN